MDINAKIPCFMPLRRTGHMQKPSIDKNSFSLSQQVFLFLHGHTDDSLLHNTKLEFIVPVPSVISTRFFLQVCLIHPEGKSQGREKLAFWFASIIIL